MNATSDQNGISLIVATMGRQQPLVRLFGSLVDQSNGIFEIIVVDQNETDLLRDVLAQFAGRLPLRRITSPPGLSRARNIGLGASRGAIVGFPDDDCWYPPGVVERVLAVFGHRPSLDILLGRTVDADGRASLNPARDTAGSISKSNVWFSGNSNTLFVRRPLATRLRFNEELGVGAPSAFQSGEETDFILRGLMGGSEAAFEPALVIHHEQVEAGRGRAQFRRAWRYSLGFGRVLRLHYPPSYTAYRVGRSLGGALAWLVRGDVPKCASRLIWSAGTVAGWAGRP
jgi:glycosyltransferase involved in cell wall biosynthesis